MRTLLVAVFGFAFSTALGAVAGCGAEPGPDGTGEAAASQGEAITLELPHYFTVRRDLRRCRHPMCGGWFVEEANKSMPETYVTGLDLSQAGLEDGAAELVLGAPDRDLVLRGFIGADRRLGLRELVVTKAFRGMPGFERDGKDTFFVLRCLEASCNALEAYPLDRYGAVALDALSVDRVLAPFVSGAWLADRVERHGAVVAGHLWMDGLTASGAPERVLEASQVFVGLPVASGPCLLLHHVCREPLEPTYTRNADLCLVFDACVKPAMCPMMVPHCAKGYTITSWPAGEHACPAYACNPSFLVE